MYFCNFNAYIYTLGAASIISFFFFALDKIKAKKGGTRIPEIALLTLAAFGGGGGALLGMYLLSHKTNFASKFHFAISVWLALFVQLALVFFLALYEKGAF